MLRYEVNFTSPLPPPSARGAVLWWTQTVGYRPVSPPFLSAIEVERGSWVGNFGSLNPRNWRVRIRARFRPSEVEGSGSEVTLEWTVTTAGQVGTKADLEFWQYEIDSVMRAALGYQPELAAYRLRANRAQSGDTWRALVFTFALLTPLIGFLIAGSFLMAIVGTAIGGVVTYFSFRAPRVIPEVAVPAPPSAVFEVPSAALDAPPARPGEPPAPSATPSAPPAAPPVASSGPPEVV